MRWSPASRHPAASRRRPGVVRRNGSGCPPPSGRSSAIAAFLGGAGHAVEVIDAGTRKALEIEVIVPVDDMASMGEALDVDEAPGGPAAGPEARRSIWPSIHPRLLELIRAHRSTLIFVNSRRLAERLAARLNELAGEELVRAHHGSIAREQRLEIEEALKAGRLPALVATSSLELGIDMGAIDLVVQVEAPPSVASGLQRIGRAGHQVGEASRGKIFPKYRGDLLEAAVVVPRMEAGQIEETRIPRTPLDVLAQQVVAICSQEAWTVEALHALVTRAENYRELSREQLEGVLDMLSGRYPSDEFAELKAADRLGPHCRNAPEPQRRTGGGGHVRGARSRTAASTACSCPTVTASAASASASSTRRWSTSRGWARCSSSAPARGASRRSGRPGDRDARAR